MRLGYLNGQWVPEAEVRISAYDLSVMQGAAAFEMLRSFNKQHFKVAEHLTRLRESCRLLMIPLPDDFERLPSIIEELTERNKDAFAVDDEYRLLIVVSPGCSPMYREIAGTIPHSYTYATVFPLRYTVAGMGKYFTEGVKLEHSYIQQVSSYAIPARAKHRSRLHFHLAQQQIQNMYQDGRWALLFDQDDKVAECPGANLIAIMNERLVSPSADALNGISQQFLLSLAKERGMFVEWKSMTFEDLMEANEIWITGTPFCMLPVTRVDGVPISTLGPLSYYREFLGLWSQRVGLPISEQIIRWDAAC